MLDFKKIQDKWQKNWKKSKVFNVEVTDYSKKKYYVTTPYPYMSGLLHLGHLFNYVFPEVVSRYKRMQGYNVLFKFGFHCTGTPIVAAAQRVKENEPTQIKILKQLGIKDSEIPKFAKPEYWVKYFPKETLKDLNALGFSIDERYTFITTSLNPSYDAFIRWQFNKLKEKGYVKKGKHPVVWCPKDNSPVGDHARSEGEGETPQEFSLFKFKLDSGDFIVTATLRPDTFLGITNVYANPDTTYVRAKVNGEVWIVGKPVTEKLKNQEYDVNIIEELSGKELIGQYVTLFGKDKILVLPASFLKAEYGTGLVHSVPSDSADDLMALQNLQENDDIIKKYNLNSSEIKSIKPIDIFDTPGIKGTPAQFFLDKYKVKSQNERDKLEQIKKELYKLTFNQSTFNNRYEKYFSKKLKGVLVKDGQDIVKEYLKKEKIISPFYELTGKVICRCLTECVVKIVNDQWFLEYDNPDWKKITHKCLDNLKMYPEIVRKQFDYVLDWLKKWACARELGLGTKLPWDDNWVIESLSDSTLQMCYNTISKYLLHPKDNDFKIKELNDSFFDYVFYGTGDINEIESVTGIKKSMLETMRKEFDYWYPFDFRNSAKDLIQNHLAFCLFNHTALFDESKWPVSYALNGRIMVDNQKMSKSKGNFFTARELYEKYGSDIVRLTAANAGEGIDDANFDMSFLDTAGKKLTEFHSFVLENYNKGRDDKLSVDGWFESVINNSIKETTEFMENIQFKSALFRGFLELQRNLKWYTRRTSGNYNKSVINHFIKTQIKILAPFTPHICEELWSMIGEKEFVSNAPWPEYDSSKINISSEKGEELITQILVDLQAVLKLAKIEKPSTINLIVAPSWKYDFLSKLKEILQKTKDFKEVLVEIMKTDLKLHSKHITKMLPKYVKTGFVPDTLSQTDELEILSSSKEFLSKEYFGAEIIITSAENCNESKKDNAMPGKPAILVS